MGIILEIARDLSPGMGAAPGIIGDPGTVPEIGGGHVPRKGVGLDHVLETSGGPIPWRGRRSPALGSGPDHIPGTRVAEFIGHGQEIDKDHVPGTEEAPINQAGDEVIQGRGEDKLEPPTHHCQT